MGVPRAWEEALNANIRVRDAAGEAATDIGLPRERAGEIQTLRPGQGLYHVDQTGKHFVLKSAQGSSWFVVLSKKAGGTFELPSGGGKGPSPLALAIVVALIGGAIMTLLAKVAFGHQRRPE
ncbi:MAG: hypothetical protein IPG71_12660 [bacterium]|nr:hypothetical protein [bacterium]